MQQNKRFKKAGYLAADELAAFCTRISMMLAAGIAPSDGLALMEKEAASKEEVALLGRMTKEMGEGAALHEVLASSGRFPPYMTGMVRIGELSGRLDEVLGALSSYYRREDALVRGVRGAVAYPAAMVLILVAVVFVIVTRMLPMFEQAYRDLGGTLSPTAQMLTNFGRAAEQYALWFALALAAAVIAGFFYLRGDSGRLLRVFGGGRTAKSLMLSRYTSAMALMLASGIDADEAARSAAGLVEGSVLQAQAQECQRLVEGGASLDRAAEEAGLITGVDAGLLSAGLRSGSAERAMDDIAERARHDADDRLDRAVGRVEPILVAVLCAIVGLILLSVMLPLAGVLSAIG